MAVFMLHLWETVCYLVIFVVGVFGNAVVCVVILKSGPPHRKFYHVPFNVYLMSLAIVDFALAVVSAPSYVMSTSYYDTHPRGTNGTILCKTITGYLLCFWLAGTSVYLLVIISFERYGAICKPFQAITRRTSTSTIVCIAAAWVIGFLIQLPSAWRIRTINTTRNVNQTSYHNATVGNHCFYQWNDTKNREITYALLLVIQYFVPASIFLFNFYRIQKSLRRLDETLGRHFQDPRQRINVVNEKRKTVKIVFIASAAFFICWTPNNIMFFLFQYGSPLVKINYDAWYYQAAIVLGFSSCCINPILYALHSKQFRGHCSKVFATFFKRRTENLGIWEKTSYQKI